jgi:hypothetical protein
MMRFPFNLGYVDCHPLTVQLNCLFDLDGGRNKGTQGIITVNLSRKATGGSRGAEGRHMSTYANLSRSTGLVSGD